MVNLALLVLSGFTLLVWLLQEVIARKQTQNKLESCVSDISLRSAADIDQRLAPAWSEWAFRLLLVLWLVWVGMVVKIKDGDFALVLVVLTLLSAVVGGLDKYWFERSRSRFAEAAATAELLTGFATQQRQKITALLREQLVVAEYARSFFPVLGLVLVLRSFVVEPFQIPSSSMEPTLLVGDYILVNKFSYGMRLPVLGTKIVDVGEPARGDVMVFFPPTDNRYFIKRVIGLSGDKIDYIDKVLYINGAKADQQLLALLPPVAPVERRFIEDLIGVKHPSRVMLTPNPMIPDGVFPVTVKPGHYFMMGDNRDNSSDSRVWGQVPEANIVGKAFAVWMHWPSLTQLPRFDRVGAID